ncbi:hypothetical protein K432DRAFT_321990 [Lepidopterella palustris CBS 459.81]|uniref:Vacuolar membrane-associated protein IML1 n=1 Tax=Lepidopterella palustris CBS 459.81 TaxID=1314670 RepID=A0A8E2JIS1_9PEZI|nr:hypothetical protein K432DRAFT_321990 [Lepidopterella palustris CBS 459.81]
MSKSSINVKPTRVQKICTLWTHDDNLSKDEVVFNVDKFAELSISFGTLARIIALKQSTAVRDFQAPLKPSSGDQRQTASAEIQKGPVPESQIRKARRHSVTITLDENGASIQGSRDVDLQKSYVFVTKQMTPEQKSKYPNLQISISETIAKVFGFRNRMQVIVTTADEETHSASHVEIAFRDEYLTRADMWQMAISELSHKTVYRGQKLLFIGTIKATVKNVFINGQTTHSGYFSSVTKPIFRSESARYVLFIQMSREMWNFDAEGAGEIMFNKVVNGFLPDLFKRWMKINARHLVTIILFTRLEYEGTTTLIENQSEEGRRRINKDSQGRLYTDFYRVVVSEVASGDWINILYQLKKEFRTFLRDVSLMPKDTTEDRNNEAPEIDHKSSQPEFVIAGTPSMASNGNILEAINLAAAQFAKDYIDRDLVRTGISVVVITAGTGVYEVDYNMLKLTTDTLVGTGIGIDLVCLSPMPLHSVPLFKYRNPRLVSGQLTKPLSQTDRSGSLDATLYDEHDERTPRQNRPNFGSLLTRSPVKPGMLNPSSSITVNSDAVPGEWSYAMPHWIDISFWSGPSDEIIELSLPKHTWKSHVKPRGKGKRFNLRCRMYELQMMGVMENELSNISIPYMEEDPLYPYGLRAYSEGLIETPRGLMMRPVPFSDSASSLKHRIPDRSPPEDDIKHGRSLQSMWMSTYDEHVFRPLAEKRAVEEKYRKVVKKWEQTEDPPYYIRETKDSMLSTSFNSPPHSLGSSGRPPPHTNFHQLMKERSQAETRIPHESISREAGFKSPAHIHVDEPSYQENSLSRQKTSSGTKDLMQRPDFNSRPSSRDSRSPGLGASLPHHSYRELALSKRTSHQLLPLPTQDISPKTTKNDKNDAKPTGWLSRQISFGGLSFGASKATASATVSSGSVEAAKMTVENNQKGLIAAKLASTRSQDTEKPSQPIAIRAVSRASVISVHSPEHASKSVETVRSIPDLGKPEGLQPASVTKDPGSLFLLAGSRGLLDQVGRKPDLSSSGGGQDIPRTLSPTSALSPWLVLVNPCNPRKNTANLASQFRRWQHVFPKPLRASAIKWKSLCSPAAVPLTNEYFPTAEQLATEYHESPYKITQNEDDETAEVPKSRESLVRELIAFRLSQGFQIVVGAAVAEFAGGREHDIARIFDSKYMSNDGDMVFMAVGNTIHQLVCVAGGEVEVKRYNRKPTTALETSAGVDSPLFYRPLIRTALDRNYHPRDIVLKPPRKEYNWNYIDSFLAGYDDEFSETLRFWRARFVLIPVELPSVTRRPLPLLTEDSEEEIRLEGIRKLTQIWQRFRYIPPEERHFQASAIKGKDPNPLAIEYQTRDPSAIVAAGPESSLLTEGDSSGFPSQLFSETEQYQTSNIDLNKLAEDLQGEKGIQMLDRRWHLRLHYNCFLGFDLTSWLLQNFKDIATRDEAVELGNQLMKRGLFQHVQKKHQFRDGNFFYQIATEYRTPRPDSRTGWFGTRRSDKSVPSTPLSEGQRNSPLTSRSTRSRPSTGNSSGASGDGEKTPTRAGTPKRAVTLSRVMRYDVDSRKRSYRPEIINLHYDRLHNPDNCYHIRIDWMNVTAKLIEDSIITWANSVEKYGLKLVEVPISQASNISNARPFRSPYIIRLALPPPKSQPEQYFDATHFAPQAKPDHLIYHKALLRKLNFVLDMEAASSFPPDVDVTYSWGRPDYRYTQFIHKTGVLLAQITDEGDLLLLANRLCNNRATSSRDSLKFKPSDPYDRRTAASSTSAKPNSADTPSRHQPPHRSPFSSPLAPPVQDSSVLHSITSTFTAEKSPQPAPQTPGQIKDEVEAFCADPAALKSFYDDAFRQRVSPSPHTTPEMDSSIPTIGLPPSITVREASPAPNLGASLMGRELGGGGRAGSGGRGRWASDGSGGG